MLFPEVQYQMWNGLTAYIILVNHTLDVGGTPRWPMQSPTKKESERLRGKEVRSSLFILDLKEDKL